MKHLITLLLLILFSFNSNAQEFKLGKVSIAELEQKKHPKDTAAVAAILFKKGEVKFMYVEGEGFKVVTDVALRIKIYKKEGYDWANYAIRFLPGTGSIKESVLYSDAVTYNLVDGKIEKTKLKSEGEFEEKIDRYWSRKKITMPNVKEGSIVEFSYKIQSSRIGTLREFYFQNDIPVDYAEYKTYVPEYFIYNSKLKGFVTPQINVEKFTKSLVFNNKERIAGRFGTSSTEFTTDKLDYQETKTTYIVKDMPAIKEEAFVNNIDNYTSSLVQELSMTKYPNEPLKPYSTDWNSVAKTIYDYDDFGAELNKTGYFENDLKTVIAGLTTQDEIISAVLNYVKTNVKWNEYYGYSCNDGVKKAYKDKTGNVAEINLMLTAMLRYAGLNANPVLVSTRNNGISLFPNRTAFNYVIASVETANGNVLLDATSKFSSPNILPFRVLNWQGRLIRKDGSSEEVDLMPKKISNDNVFVSYKIDTEGKITGKVRRQYTEYNAMFYRNEIDKVKEDEYLEKLENENNKIEVSEYSRTNEKEVLSPVIESFSFKGDNLSEIIGNKIYVNPMLFFTRKESSFKQETRQYPIDFGFPFSDKYNITIQIPEGFTVEALPAPAVVEMADNLGIFKFNIAANENTLQLSIVHQINEAIVSAENYDMLKEYYKAMINKETEKIVLKRI